MRVGDRVTFAGRPGTVVGLMPGNMVDVRPDGAAHVERRHTDRLAKANPVRARANTGRARFNPKPVKLAFKMQPHEVIFSGAKRLTTRRSDEARLAPGEVGVTQVDGRAVFLRGLGRMSFAEVVQRYGSVVGYMQAEGMLSSEADPAHPGLPQTPEELAHAWGGPKYAIPWFLGTGKKAYMYEVSMTPFHETAAPRVPPSTTPRSVPRRAPPISPEERRARGEASRERNEMWLEEWEQLSAVEKDEIGGIAGFLDKKNIERIRSSQEDEAPVPPAELRRRRAAEAREQAMAYARIVGRKPSLKETRQFREISGRDLSTKLQKNNAVFFTRPDPPRLGNDLSSYCGNPVDGMAYYLIVSGQSRQAGTWLRRDQVLAAAREAKVDITDAEAVCNFFLNVYRPRLEEAGGTILERSFGVHQLVRVRQGGKKAAKGLPAHLLPEKEQRGRGERVATQFPDPDSDFFVEDGAVGGATFYQVSRFASPGRQALSMFEPYAFRRLAVPSIQNVESLPLVQVVFLAAKSIGPRGMSPELATALVLAGAVRQGGQVLLNPNQTGFKAGTSITIGLPDKAKNPFYSWVTSIVPVGQEGKLLAPCLTEEDEAVRQQLTSLKNLVGRLDGALGRVKSLFATISDPSRGGPRRIKPDGIFSVIQGLANAYAAMLKWIGRMENEEAAGNPAAARVLASFKQSPLDPHNPRSPFYHATTKYQARGSLPGLITSHDWSTTQLKITPRKPLAKQVEKFQKEGYDIEVLDASIGLIRFRLSPTAASSEIKDLTTFNAFMNAIREEIRAGYHVNEPQQYEEQPDGTTTLLIPPGPRAVGRTALAYLEGKPTPPGPVIASAMMGTKPDEWIHPLDDLLEYIAPSIRPIMGEELVRLRTAAVSVGEGNPNFEQFTRIMQQYATGGMKVQGQEVDPLLGKRQLEGRLAAEEVARLEREIESVQAQLDRARMLSRAERDQEVPNIAVKVRVGRLGDELERLIDRIKMARSVAVKGLRVTPEIAAFELRKPPGWPSWISEAQQLDTNWAVGLIGGSTYLELLDTFGGRNGKALAVDLLTLARFYDLYGGYLLSGPLNPNVERGTTVLDGARQAINDAEAAVLGGETGIGAYRTYNPVLFELTRLFWPAKEESAIGRGGKEDVRSWGSLLEHDKAVIDVDTVGLYGLVAATTQRASVHAESVGQVKGYLQHLLVPIVRTVIRTDRVGNHTVSSEGVAEAVKGLQIDPMTNESVRAPPGIYTPFFLNWRLGATAVEAVDSANEWVDEPLDYLKKLKLRSEVAIPSSMKLRRAKEARAALPPMFEDAPPHHPGFDDHRWTSAGQLADAPGERIPGSAMAEAEQQGGDRVRLMIEEIDRAVREIDQAKPNRGARANRGRR